jgi:hypothetical protein
MPDTNSTNNESGAEYLAAQLERLMKLPLATPEDEQAWNEECAGVQGELAARFPDFQFEHHVMHFFDDADIRRKDIGYRRWQHQAVSDYVARLRHGAL